MRRRINVIFFLLFLIVTIIFIFYSKEVFESAGSANNSSKIMTPQEIVELVQLSTKTYYQSETLIKKFEWRENSGNVQEIKMLTLYKDSNDELESGFNLMELMMSLHFEYSPFNTGAGGFNYSNGWIKENDSLVCLQRSLVDDSVPFDHTNPKRTITFGCGYFEE